MIRLIEDWLFNEIGLTVNLNNLSEHNIFQDGTVILNIMKQYGLLDGKFSVNLTTSSDVVQCMQNLRSFKPLFKMLKVKYDENVISCIAQGNSSVILKFLFELFVCLEDRQKLHFIHRQTYDKELKNVIDCSSEKNYKIHVEESKLSPVPHDNFGLEKPLIQNRDVVDWYRDKCSLIQNNLEQRLNKLNKTKETFDNEKPTTKRTKDLRDKCCIGKYSDTESLPSLGTFPLPNVDHEDKCSLIKNNLEQRSNKLNKTKETFDNEKPTTKRTTDLRDKCCIGKCSDTESLPNLDTFPLPNVDHEVLLSYEEFIASYNEKQQRKAAQKCFQNHIQNYLLEETWNKIKARQKELYDSVFSEIMLKQSQYEKQIVTKLIQTQHQVKLQNEHKMQNNRLISSTEESQRGTDQIYLEFQEIEKMYAAEQTRVQELHKKLYNEKQERIKKRHYSFCYDIVSDIVDISLRVCEYKKLYNTDLPKRLWNDWMQMFFKGQSVHNPLERLQREALALEDRDVDYDDIIHLEKLQDEILNTNDIEEYLLTTGKWFYEAICLEGVDLNKNILAHIVHRLLSIKYPPPPTPLPAELPFYKLAGIVTNFNNVEHINTLNILLSKQKCHVFNPDMAIKKCIEVFNTESSYLKNLKSTEEEKLKEVNRSRANNSSKRDKKDTVKTKTKKPRKGEQIQKNNDELILKIIVVTHKETQTSIIKELDEKFPVLSSLARIGEEVTNCLKDGELISDDLMVSVIIEYLKRLEDIEGWIIVNFPLNLKEASILELALSGKHLPVEKYETDENKMENFVTDELSEKRKSKILVLPDDDSGQSPFKTFFSVFIKAKEDSSTFEVGSQELTESNIENNDNSTEKSHVDTLEIFYKDQSVFKEFILDGYNINNIKRLAKQILNGTEVSETTSIELFGEDALKQISKKATNKKDKPSISRKNKRKTPPLKKKSKRGSSLNSSPIEKIKKEIENNSCAPASIVFKTLKNLLNQDQQPNIVDPGDNKFKIVSLTITNEVGEMLATMWENIEIQYISNLNDTFFEIRVINSRLDPYSKYAREEINKIRKKVDTRQDLITIFQNDYNSIEPGLRTVSEVKSRLHCQVLKLQQNLWKITDDRKLENELKRQEIIKGNWLVNEICMLINSYLSLIQTEFDKSVDTLKLLQYYYLSMLDSNLPTSINIPNSDFKVARLSFLSSENDVSSLGSSSRSPSKSIHASGSFDTYSRINNFIQESLVNCEEPQHFDNVLNEFIINQIELTVKKYQSIVSYFTNQIRAEASSRAPSTKKTTKQGKSKLTEVKRSSLGETDVLKTELLNQEWNYVFDSEKENLLFRLGLIKKRSGEDVLGFYRYLEAMFCDLYTSNLEEYNNDIRNIDKLCEYLRYAIEEETALNNTLVLKENTFFIQSGDDSLYRPSDIKCLIEDTHNCYFTIHQLNNLKDIFMIAGPNGIIRKQPFCYICQDLALSNDKYNQPHLPKLWSLLNESQLTAVMDKMFGSEFEVDWRDFIIYNLDIPFPTIDEILSLRKIFLCYDLEETETVSRDDYENTSLWFEEYLPSNPEEGLRLGLAKNLLFELFKVNEHCVKYTALLLYFCKDVDQRNGLKKALSLSVGKYVVTSEEELEILLLEEKEIQNTVTNVLTDIINSIVHEREGVLIYEVNYDFDLNENEINGDNTISLCLDSSTVDEDELLTQVNNIMNDEEGDNKLLTSQVLQNLDKEWVENRWWVSKIPLTTIESVLNASFRLHDGTFSSMKGYFDAFEDMADKDGAVEGYVLMSSSFIRNLFETTKKFAIVLPCNIIQEQI